MSGMNKAIVIGRLGQDPEIRYLQNGRARASFSIATNESWTDKKNGDRKEKTEWHRIIAWGKTAELVGQYLGKGRQVCVEGRLQTRSWNDKDGIERKTTEIVASSVTFLDSRKQQEAA